jgi:hypothetical protein
MATRDWRAKIVRCRQKLPYRDGTGWADRLSIFGLRTVLAIGGLKNVRKIYGTDVESLARTTTDAQQIIQ